ncbi:Uncharacterised protein [Streptococcus criceti]|uniref:Uncharacterized protein n=1 Tax=Streptococcus criceti HS-6 TaxID=873449 RepID=G5JS73_STRCG|nr:hypothetical protein STRCR_0851 [Streptococcus criceti HS-6]SUN43625.1 Uncharacterised protein [Streptococcus criceti]
MRRQKLASLLILVVLGITTLFRHLGLLAQVINLLGLSLLLYAILTDKDKS